MLVDCIAAHWIVWGKIVDITDSHIYIEREREIKCVPKMEPWDTPENSISHELTIEP